MSMRTMLVSGSLSDMEVIAAELRKAGVTVSAAAVDAAGAISAAQRVTPEIVILDETIGGLPLAKHLSDSGLAVVLLSGQTDPAYRQAAAAHGVVLLLPKPLDIDRLVQRLSQIAGILAAA
jgi:DNA-binding NarL/FixJ family response regulator